ncbi:unnamed protein product [marine sediment metagenome]|uniref:Extracellular solute-binding protein n=1 Tax=marine sediment metagenome TaxID=412755 RepID=X1EPU1_9ZZZZ
MSSDAITEVLGSDNVSAIFPPSVKGNIATQSGRNHYVITSASKHKEEAWEVVSWLLSPKQVVKLIRIMGGVPVIKNPGKYDPYFIENKFQRVSNELAPYTYVPEFLETLGPFVESAWPENFQKALLGKITPDEMMDAISKVLEGE